MAGITQKTIGDGNGGTFSANFIQTAGGNYQPAPAASGLGTLTLVPAGTTNGTALASFPEGAVGVRLYLGISDTVTFTVASTAPSSAPSVTYTISGASGGTGPNWDENLSSGQMIYVTATSGTPKFRWF